MIKILFVTLIMSISGGVLFKLSPIPGVQIYLFDLISILIVIFSFPYISSFVLHNYKKLTPFFIFGGVGLIGIILNTSSYSQLLVSLGYLIRLYIYLLLFIPLFKIAHENSTFLKECMIASGAIFIAFGYTQYIYYPNLSNLYYMGWDDHLYRLFSTFLDPNFSGTFILLILISYLGFIMENFNTTKLKKILLLLGILFITPALMLTYSRSSFIASVAAIVIFLLLVGQKKLVILFIILFFSSLVILPQGLHSEGVHLLRTASVFSRFETYKNTREIIERNPIVGVGFNSLRFVNLKYGFTSASNVLVSHSDAGVPNSYLFLLATTGITGFTVFLFILYKLFLKLIKQRRVSGNFIFSSVVIASISGVAINSLFENSLFFAPVFIWLVLLVGLLLGKNAKV